MKIGELDVSKIMLGSAEVEKIYLGTEQVYSGGSEPTPPHDYSQDYLTIVAGADNMSVRLESAGNNVYQYSVDSGTTWSNLANNASTTAVYSGETIMFKASGLTPIENDGIGDLLPSVSASVQGNIMSLVYGDNFSGQTTITSENQFFGLFMYSENIISAENLILPATTLSYNCYNNMFRNCTSLVNTPALPATTLSQNCYSQMFRACRSLMEAPELPATTLAESCYRYMFYGCTSLEEAPELSATTLEDSCYYNMFRGCTNLNYIKCLATDNSADLCTYNWVNGVAATGTFVKAASMSDWTTGESGIPTGWTVQNDDGSPYSNIGGDYGSGDGESEDPS